MLSGESHERCISPAPGAGNSRQHPFAGVRMSAPHIADASLTALEPRDASGRYQTADPRFANPRDRAHGHTPTQSVNSGRRRVRPASGDRSVCDSAGSPHRIRLLTHLRAEECLPRTQSSGRPRPGRLRWLTRDDRMGSSPGHVGTRAGFERLMGGRGVVLVVLRRGVEMERSTIKP